MLLEISFLLIAVFLVFLCALFVASEFSFVTVDRATVHEEARMGSKRALGLQKALKRLSTHLSSAQVGITLTNLLIGFLAEPSLAQLLEGPLEGFGISEGVVSGIAFTSAFIIANLITMLFGELVPKNIAIAKPLSTAKGVQSFQRIFSYLISPLLIFSNGLANRTLLFLGIEPQEELASARSAEELESLVKRSAREGTLDLPTARLLEQTLEFSERNAEDAMTPRAQVKTLSPDNSVADLLDLVKKSGRSRFPLLKGEDIVGVAHLRDGLGIPLDKRKSVLLGNIAKEPLLVPASLDLDLLLMRLRQESMQIALVIDEFGSFHGVVTLEDLVEEIVGEVHDEHDLDESEIVQLSENEWEMSGLLRPDEIFREIGIDLPEDRDYETVAGLLIDRLEQIPKIRDSVEVAARDSEANPIEVMLRVRELEGMRIHRVYLRVKDD